MITPGASMPEECRDGVRTASSIAAATNPRDQASRAARMRDSRVVAPAPAAISRSRVHAQGSFRTSCPGSGRRPPGSHCCAESVQCRSNSSRTRAIVATVAATQSQTEADLKAKGLQVKAGG